MGEGTHASIYSEVQVAISFVTSFMNKVVPQGRVKAFGDALARALMNKYEGHWFPECPLKGSAFRCFEFGRYIEPEIKDAAQQAGLRCRDVLRCVPSEMSIWVDPGTVSYRIGIDGTVKPVLNESGCVTCFYDPDLDDREPDNPGISSILNTSEETEVLDLNRVQKLNTKRGKSKYEDVKFITENGKTDSAMDFDDLDHLEPLEPYLVSEDTKSGILCDEEFVSNHTQASDEPIYGSSRRRRSRRSKKDRRLWPNHFGCEDGENHYESPSSSRKSPNKPVNGNGSRGRNNDKRRQSNDSNNNNKVCNNSYQNRNGNSSGSVATSSRSSSSSNHNGGNHRHGIGGSNHGDGVGSSSAGGAGIAIGLSVRFGISVGGRDGGDRESSCRDGGGIGGGGIISTHRGGGGGSSGGSSSNSHGTTTTTTTTNTNSSSNMNVGGNNSRNTRSSSGRNSRGGSTGSSSNGNSGISNGSSRTSNNQRNRNVLRHQSIVINNSSYSSRA